MMTYLCDKKCCCIEIARPHLVSGHPFDHKKGNYTQKAGVFIYDPEEHRVLLVQSRGQLWGPPKGTLELAETPCDCAIREVKEETGLDVTASEFSEATTIKNRAMYYYAEKKVCPVHIQGGIFNDANGITWIKIECLEDCIKTGKIVLNQHCKIIFKRFLKKTFPKSEFVKVEPKKRRKSKRCSR